MKDTTTKLLIRYIFHTLILVVGLLVGLIMLGNQVDRIAHTLTNRTITYYTNIVIVTNVRVDYPDRLDAGWDLLPKTNSGGKDIP